MDRLDAFRADLARLADAGRARRLMPRAGVDFASNDYLGLAGHPRLAQAVRAALDDGVPVGAAGSRLLRGNTEWHEAFEAKAAAFFGAEAALCFGGGYQANLALLGTLPQRGDLVLLDKLSHASTREGARMTRAEVAEFRHSDPGHAEDVITAWRGAGGAGAVWIAVESLYSMDGDRAPLEALAALADREGFLIVDEALSVGDRGFRQRSEARIRDIRNNAGTIFLVSHSMKSIRDTCDRVLWIHRGKLRMDGPTEDVLKAYESSRSNGRR